MRLERVCLQKENGSSVLNDLEISRIMRKGNSLFRRHKFQQNSRRFNSPTKKQNVSYKGSPFSWFKPDLVSKLLYLSCDINVSLGTCSVNYFNNS